MFDTFKKRLRDAGTLQKLLEAAERHANENGQTEPGAEHLLLAALEMPDGTARRSFERLGASPAGFREAIARQYAEALRTVGMGFSGAELSTADVPVQPTKGIYKAKASAQTLMRELTEMKPFNTALPLLGADILVAATASEHTIALRALRAMGVDPAALAASAKAEIASYVEQPQLLHKG
jgi:ATP-dependent Clp protease ATP-binding subunit ClpA